MKRMSSEDVDRLLTCLRSDPDTATYMLAAEVRAGRQMVIDIRNSGFDYTAIQQAIRRFEGESDAS